MAERPPRLRLRGVEAAHVLDVRPSDEGALARAREDDDARRVVLGELAQPVAELGQRLDVERVERVLPVDRDDGDRVVAPLDEDAQAGTAPRMKSTISVVGAPGPKTPATPSFRSSSASSSGIVPPTTTSDVLGAVLAQELEDSRHEGHVRAGEDRDADGVGVLLDRGLDDLLGRLVQPGVDDLHPGVAKRAGDDLRAAIVPVEARLRDDDADLPCHGAEPSSAQKTGVSRQCPRPRAARRTSRPSSRTRATRP